MKDLVVLVADTNMQFALQGALARHQALGIRPLTYEFRVHPGRDGGVRTTGVDVLAPEANRFQYALMLLDLHGCGREDKTPTELEGELDEKLQPFWSQRAKAIVIAPEVDIWLWGNDNAMREALHWLDVGSIRDWLRTKGFEFNTDGKPLQPKEAMEAVCRMKKQPRSSALYQKITSKISLQKCNDEAFKRLKTALGTWFKL
jgi:hypothetical protein